MDVIFLGTSGHGVVENRNLPSALIDNFLLLDCGEGTLKQLKKNGISLDSIKIILLTHLHADHFLGIISILWEYAFYNEIKTPSPVIYLPEGMKNRLESIIENTFSPFERVGFKVEIKELPLNPNKLVIEENKQTYNIKWIKTNHTPLCYAYNINEKIVFSGDTAPLSELSSFAKNVEILVHEASFWDEGVEIAHIANHSTPLDAAKIALRSGVNKLLLYHLPHLESTNEKRFIEKAVETFSNIEITHDNYMLTI